MRKQASRVRNNHTVAVLGTVVIKFLVCYTLPTLLNLLEFVKPAFSSHWVYGTLVEISNFLVVFLQVRSVNHTRLSKYCQLSPRLKVQTQEPNLSKNLDFTVKFYKTFAKP